MTSYVHPGMATEFRGSFHPNDVHVVYWCEEFDSFLHAVIILIKAETYIRL